MALEASGDFLKANTFCLGTRKSREKSVPKEVSQKRKNSFAGKKAEREQVQPQLYGTSYFLVRNTPTGQVHATRQSPEVCWLFGPSVLEKRYKTRKQPSALKKNRPLVSACHAGLLGDDRTPVGSIEL
jgi:hypothetical protein